MYDTLVLSGNSTNAIYTLGAVQRLLYCKTISLNKLTTFIGTSSGSMICLMLALGIEPLDILTYVCVNKSYSKMSGINILNFGTSGLMSFDTIEKEVEGLILTQHDSIPTLDQLHDRYGKILICVTFNMTDGEKEYVSYLNYPDLPVTKAIRMSCSFPLVFCPFEYNGKYYVDGGVVDNFAMKRAQEMGGKCIGIYNVNTIKPYTPDTSNFEMMFRLFSIFVCSIAESSIAQPGNKIIRLVFEPCFFNFNSTNSELIKQFDYGYDNCKSVL